MDVVFRDWAHTGETLPQRGGRGWGHALDGRAASAALVRGSGSTVVKVGPFCRLVIT